MNKKRSTPNDKPKYVNLLALTTLWFCITVNATASSSPNLQITPPPEWTTDIPLVESQDLSASPKSGTIYLLVDKQIDARNGWSAFSHFAFQLTDEEAIEENASFSVEFDPAFQRLEIHSIKAWRNGKPLNKLDADKIELLQREQQLERLIYDGRLTASLILEDIRKDDILEYSYTIHGSNPALDGHFSQQFRTQWNVPVQRQFYRLLWRSERPLHITPVNTDLSLKRIDTSTHSAYQLDIENTPPLTSDSDTPAWHMPWGRFNFSDISNWQDVVRWALPKYRQDDTLPSELYSIVSDIRTAHDSKKAQAAAALEFVQNEIRYQGIEIGIGGFQPHPPTGTLARRYGDCKDKTLLFLTLLKALDIEAHPVLVNTSTGRTLDADAPRVDAFNHVMALVVIKGREYWLDPTINNQYGGIDVIYQPDYGQALVLSEKSSKLVPMYQEQTGHSRLFQEQFDLSNGAGKPVDYRLHTVYSGSAAEAFRHNTNSLTREQLEKNYLEYYSDYYPSIKALQPLSINDDRISGKITVDEHYVIPDFWENNDENRKHYGQFYSNAIYPYTKKPDTRRRISPLSLQHPVEVGQKITVLLDEQWNFENEETAVDTPFFNYTSRARFDRQQHKLVLNYHYQSRADHVPTTDSEAYIASLDQVKDNLDYRIFSNYRQSAEAGQPTEAGAATDTGLSQNQFIAIYFGIVAFIFLYSFVEYRVNKRNEPNGEGAAYYPVSSLKFFLLSFISFGIYFVFWFYRNWHYVKQREQSAIMPWARAFFCSFWYYPLYRSIEREPRFAEGPGKKTNNPFFLLLAILFFIAASIANGTEDILGYIGLVVAILCALPLVERVNAMTPTDNPSYKFNSRWRSRHFAIGLFFGSVIAFDIAVQINFIPDTSIIEGRKLWQRDIQFMHRIGAIDPGQKIEFFYSDGFLSNRTDGNGFTKSHVFSYWHDETTQQFQLQTAPYEEIEDIEYTWGKQGDKTVAKVIRNDGSHFLLIISSEDGKDHLFVKRMDALFRQHELR